MAISKMTPAQIKKINSEIRKALAGVEEKFGVSIDFGNSTYQHTEYRTKMTVSLAGDNGIKKIIDAHCYIANDDFNETQPKPVFSKKDSIIGSVMKGRLANGQEFTVVDYDFSKPKNKWTIKVGDKQYVCPTASMVSAKVVKKATFADMVIK